jgi:tetratricopeptide (TPR) repeat protein
VRPFRFLIFCCFAFLLLVCSFALANDPVPAVNPAVTAAERLLRSGQFPEAEAAFREILKTTPELMRAQVGLVRAMLREQKIDDAFVTVNASLAAQPGSAALLAEKGEIEFRRAEMEEAERDFLGALKADPKEVHAYLGLANLYRSYSLYRRAYDLLETAHRLAPENFDVQRVWMGMLPRKQRVAALEAYLNGPHPEDADQTRYLQDMLAFLKATAEGPVHACRLVSKVERTTTKLEVMYASDGRHMGGIGLAVNLNNRKTRMLLDTGAGGIVVGSKIAQKAGLTRIVTQHFGGVGDKGMQSGYAAVADHIKIGDLEFQDCVVSVSDKHSVADEDGLIGADVFGAYLVEIDLPGMHLNLSPLPKRPDEALAPTALNSEGEDQAITERKEAADAGAAKEGNAAAATATNAPRLPKDRYIAPEMANWTKVFRFGHSLLVPTEVNDSKPMLFMLDTGAFANALSLRAGKLVTKVHSDDTIRVKGLSGEVTNVYSADHAILTFAHFRAPSQNMVTLDLSTISRHMGTEISGFLGFNMLRLLTLQLDYRDGLVNFNYDEKRIPINIR